MRGAVESAWLGQKDGMGYPIGEGVAIASLVSLIVMCSASFKDAAKLSAANLSGVVCLGFLSMSPEYIEPCTHDAVLAAAWIGGCAACARPLALKAVLWCMAAAMFVGVGEFWHALGGSWCPLRESEKIGGVFLVACAAFLCSMAFYARILEARLGIRDGLWRVWCVSGLMAAGWTAAIVYLCEIELFGKFWGKEISLLFAIMPLAGGLLNVAALAVACVAGVLKTRGARR